MALASLGAGLERVTAIRRSKVALLVAVIVLGTGLGVLAAASRELLGPLGFIAELPAAALVVAVAGLALLPTALRDWRLGMAAFAVWLPFEDLVRKYAGNDIRVYFVKDILFAVALLAVARHLHAERAWRRALGEARPALLALLAWAALMAVQTTLSYNWQLAAVGLRLYFLYAPLVAVGYLVARDPALLRKALHFLAGLAVIPAVIGLIQAVVGPSFLAPTRDTKYLRLVLIRGQGNVFRPTGTFVDPGRYAFMALIGLALALGAFTLPRLGARRKRMAGAAIGVGVVALYASGGRTILVAGVLLVVAVLFRRRSTTGRKRGSMVLSAVGVVLALAVFAVAFPKQFDSRRDWYGSTLGVTSSQNEWKTRYQTFTKDAITGVILGGAVGLGTGTQTLGTTYLYGDSGDAPAQLVESGYGTVAVEMGFIGLALWIWWSVSWWRRLRRCSLAAGPHRWTAQALTAWIFLFLFVNFIPGIQGFLNYPSNAYFWFLSGVVFGLGAGRPDEAQVAVAVAAVDDLERNTPSEVPEMAAATSG